MKIDHEFAENIVNRSLKHGADEAEVFLRYSKNLTVEIKQQQVDSFKTSVSFGYGLRVIKKNRTGYSYSTDIKDRDEVITNAISSAVYADEDVFSDLPAPYKHNIKEMNIFDEEIHFLDKDEAIKRVALLESSVYKEDSRIKKIRKAVGSFTESDMLVINSKGINAGYRSTSCYAQVMAVAESSGESQAGWEFQSSRFLRDLSFEDVGRKAARRAVQHLGSKRITGFKGNIILDSSVAVEFIELFASLLSSEAVQKGKSLLAGKIGKKLISTKINILDNGLLPGKQGSCPVDDEGVPTEEKIMIKGGVLQGYLYNTYTARKDNVTSTGNGFRGSFSTLPGVGITNFYIEPVLPSERISKNDLIRTASRGLYVLSVMGLHTANPVSGDFSVGVTGLLIEKGEINHPVKEAIISGNILDFFNKIEATGDDMQFYSNVGSPCLLILDVDISG